MKQNEIAAQAVNTGAFGGGREGVQQAESERARLQTIGQLRGQGFNTALGIAVVAIATSLLSVVPATTVGVTLITLLCATRFVAS